MNRRSGFTLIELMIVVIIMAALAGMVLPKLINRVDIAKEKIAEADIATISQALKMYKLDNGSYPTALNALMSAPTSSESWKGPYFEDDPVDPWGNDYEYKSPGSHKNISFDIWSPGPDGQSGTADDVNNWDKKRSK
jgi:general secretion pathway protein G